MNADSYETRMITDGDDDKTDTRKDQRILSKRSKESAVIEKHNQPQPQPLQEQQQKQLLILLEQRLSETQQSASTSVNQLNTNSHPIVATTSPCELSSGCHTIISGSRPSSSISSTRRHSNICHHQEILANVIPEVSNRMTETSLSLTKRHSNPQLEAANLNNNSNTTNKKTKRHKNKESEQSIPREECNFPQLVDSNSNSFLFWKYLSNLPKSITQRSKSSGSSTLTPEVAGYLASKEQCSNIINDRIDDCGDDNDNDDGNNYNEDDDDEKEKSYYIKKSHNQKVLLATNKSKSKIKSTPLASGGSINITMASSELNCAPESIVAASNDCQRKQQQQQQQQLLTKSPLSEVAILGSPGTVNSDGFIPSASQQNQQTSSNQRQDFTNSNIESNYKQHNINQSQNLNQNQKQNQIQNNNDKQQNQTNLNQVKLSIATTTTTPTTSNTTTTTRSSDPSLSSCILSNDDSTSSEVRLKWGKKMDFLLSIIGFAVDLANIWRFPYLVYKNGGGVFLIPYITMLIFGGIPLFFLELCLGQFVKKGPITVWNKICPSMKGVGYCSILISWYVSFYYNVLIAWSVYFIYRSLLSFGDKMPWEDCDNSWNSKSTCVSISQLKELCSIRNETLESCRKEMFANVNVTSPASEFFVKELSQIDQSTGLDDMGYLRPELVLCTIIVYFLHYFSLFRGLETSGKVVWVTATAPYMILSILLIRGLFLPGASMGIEYYLSPKLEKLADPQVWIDAAGQVFYSIGVGFGVHLTYASFNSHNNNCYRDCLMTSAVNAATSVYSGLVVFVYLGYMAKNLGIEIDKVASEGYSLVFEVYPEALTTLPFARFWSILFFIMLLTLGIDSAMGGLEAVITGLEDEFKFAKRLSRGQLTGLVIVSSFLPALISCTQGGAYTLFWFDIYSAGVSLLFSALFETIGVVYCYGLEKFILNIESMLGKKPHIFYIVCWKYISPIFLGVVIFMSIYTASVPTYRGYTFPLWSIILGWCLAFSSVSAVPIVAAWYWYTHRGKRLETPEKSPRKRSSRCSSSAVSSKQGSNKKSSSSPNHRSISVSCSGQAQSGLTMTTRVLTTPQHNNNNHNHHGNQCSLIGDSI